MYFTDQKLGLSARVHRFCQGGTQRPSRDAKTAIRVPEIRPFLRVHFQLFGHCSFFFSTMRILFKEGCERTYRHVGSAVPCNSVILITVNVTCLLSLLRNLDSLLTCKICTGNLQQSASSASPHTAVLALPCVAVTR